MEKLGNNVQSWLTTVWIRITVSPLTIIYFCFSVLHFVAQVSLQSKALAANNLALDSLAGLVTNKTQLSSGLPIMQGSTLKLCTSIPNNMQTDNSACTVIWDMATSTSSQSHRNFTSTIQQAPSTAQPTTKSSDLTSVTEQTSSAAPSTTKSPNFTSTTEQTSGAVPSTTKSPNFTSTTEQTSGAVPSTTKSPNFTFTTEQTSSAAPSTTKSPNFTSATGQTSSAVPSTTKSPNFTTATGQTSGAVPSTTNSPNSDAKSSTTFTTSTTRLVSAAAPTVITQKPGVTPTTTTLHSQSTASSANPPSIPVNQSVSDGSTHNSRKNVSSTNLQVEDAIFLAQEMRVRTEADSLCQASLLWPISELHDMQREDIIFLAFQCWVLGVSVVALLNESIPHICASMVTHLMATSWAAFRIHDTSVFRSEFNEVVLSGACNGMQIIPDYWDTRFRLELAALIVNVVTMLISGYLTWKIFELFGWQTFKRVGASLVINRIYRLVLVLSILIQLSFFFMATTVSLWIDRMVNTPVGELASFRTLYMAGSIITLVLLIPWLATGWFGVRRELRLSMFIFLLLSLLYLGGWGVMFFATTFAWTFMTWTFFAVMASASVFLAFASFVLGIICRYNFGKGLHRHLNNPLSKFPDTSNDDIEKPKLPTREMFWPTFPHAPQTNFPSDGSKADAIRAWPQRSNSSWPSSSEYPTERNSFDALSSLEAGVTRSTSENSTGSAQAKRWVIE